MRIVPLVQVEMAAAAQSGLREVAGVVDPRRELAFVENDEIVVTVPHSLPQDARNARDQQRPEPLALRQQRVREERAHASTDPAARFRQREVIAAEMSVLLDEDVSRMMLDAYASPARAEHKVPMSRFFALVAVTGRHDLMDPLMREIGAGLLVGEEVLTARVGHVRQQIKELQAEMKRLEKSAPLIRSGGIDGQ